MDLWLKYRTQKNNAKRRKIEFLLTFEEWSDIWLASGHLEEMGRRKGNYVMSRHNDVGTYSVGNVFIQLKQDNDTVAYGNPVWNKGRTGLQVGWNKGISQPKFKCLHCEKSVAIPNLKKWHNDNCKVYKNESI